LRAGYGGGPKAPAYNAFIAATSTEAGQQHVDLDEIAEARARFVQNTFDVANDKSELSLETSARAPFSSKPGMPETNSRVADPRRERERRGFQAGGERKC